MKRRAHLFALSLVAATLAPSVALAQPTCTLHQVTHTVDVENRAASMTPNGRWIAHLATPSLDDKVFVRDLESGDVTSWGSGNQILSFPRISATGTRVLFSSTGNYLGTNPDGNRELFLRILPTGEFRQLTSSLIHPNMPTEIGTWGQWAVFTSQIDHTGQNPDQSIEYFLAAADGSSIQQLTSSLNSWYGAAFTADFSRGFLGSSEDFVGQNADGNEEVFHFNFVTGAVTQLTHTVTGSNYAAATDAQGQRVLIFTGSQEYVPWNWGGSPVPALLTTATGQVAPLLDHSFSWHFGTRMSADGHWAVSSLDGAVHYWNLDTLEGETIVPPEFPGTYLNAIGGISRDGRRIVLESFRNIDNQNPDFNTEIFQIDCARPDIFTDGFEFGDFLAWSAWGL